MVWKNLQLVDPELTERLKAVFHFKQRQHDRNHDNGNMDPVRFNPVTLLLLTNGRDAVSVDGCVPHISIMLVLQVTNPQGLRGPTDLLMV